MATSSRPAWGRAIVAALVAFVASATLPGMPRSAFFIAAAAYFALPREHRTRENAAIVGWSVGFGLVVLREICG
jgi:hypothetical protein